MSKPILLVNQTSGFLFQDIVQSVSRYNSVQIYCGLPYKRSSSFSRIYTWLFYSAKLAIHLLFHGRRYSKLFVVSNPPFAPLLAPLSLRPYALLLFDLYPVVLAQLKPKHLFQRITLYILANFWSLFNHYVCSRADRVFTLSEAMADQLRSYFPTDADWSDRVVVIPPWSDTKNMHPCPEAAQVFRSRYGIRGLLLCYSGNLGLTHPLETLLEACALLNNFSPLPSIQMLLIGNGSKLLSLQRQAHEFQLPQSILRFLDPLPYSDVPASLSAADLAVVALDGPSANASLPSKTFNALACGTPLLALTPVNSALAQLVLEHNCGFVIEPGPEAARQLVDLIIYLIENIKELKHLAINALSASYFYTSKNADRLVENWLGSASVPR